MKNSLLDIVKYISVLPFEVVKVTGTDGSVLLQSKLHDDANGQVFFRGVLKEKIPELDGVFGLSNINMLSGLARVPAFNDAESNITMKHIVRNDTKIPEELVFNNPKFGKASYRLTGEKAIPPQSKLSGSIKWDIAVKTPAPKKIADFAQLASIYSSQETKFSIKTEDGVLKFMIGDESAATHKAQVAFAEDIDGDVKPNFTWSISSVLNVLKLGNSADMTLQISNQGILQIEIDSGLGVYNYIFGGAN